MGDDETAAARYDDALAAYPGYFRALASRGRLEAALGKYGQSIADYQAAIDELPDPTFVAELGDVYRLSGNERAARRQYDLVEFIGHLSKINGVMYNRQLVMFEADHDRNARAAYAAAAREYRTRRDILGADALAWTALKAGKAAAAQAAMQSALRLGTQDPRLLYHAGMIAKANGAFATARRDLQSALQMNARAASGALARGELGAGGGNRTRDSCLEGKGITIMQRPRSLVGRAGFEPAYRFREPNLQSGAFNHSTTYPRWRSFVMT